MHESSDKAGQPYWESVWLGKSLPAGFSPRDRPTRQNHVERALHEAFAPLFGQGDTNGQTLLEIGAARSIWLPYFAREFGFEVTGIDYSEIGCTQARTILEREGIDGRIILADFSAPPADLLDQFDVVVSFGVIEHFESTAACLSAFARFLRPGGMMVSLIPNMAGVTGWLEKRVCRSIFDMHVPLRAEALCRAHQEAGFTIQTCHYFMGGGFPSLSVGCWKGHRLYPVIRRAPEAMSMPFRLLDLLGVCPRPNRLTSPYVLCVARKEMA